MNCSEKLKRGLLLVSLTGQGFTMAVVKYGMHGPGTPMWYTNKNQQMTIHILAKPNAKKTILLGATEKELLISLHAKPHHDEANIELMRYLSQLLQVPKTQIILQRGEHSRHKQVMIISTAKLQKILNELRIKFSQ